MPRRSADSATGWMPGVRARMPRRSADSNAGWMPGVLRRMPRRRAWGTDRAACPAQPGIAVDRFARAIVAFERYSQRACGT